MLTAQLKASRLAAGFTQVQLAKKLGKSQGYVSLLERGLRSPSVSVAERLANVLELPPTARPLRVGKQGLRRFNTDRAAKSLATLGYPGYAYLGGTHAPLNPTAVLLKTLAAKRVSARLAEAMPWLLLHFRNFDQKQTVMLATARVFKTVSGL